MAEMPLQLKSEQHSQLRHLAVAALAWSLLVGASLLNALLESEQETLTLARHEARANFNKDMAFRIWATRHGGVYVPVDERTPPSPWLSHIPERDIVTPSGRRLTLMNPAYMVRQMMDEFTGLYGVRGRITSLKPLNPSNAPDDWERKALESFERGVQESFELTDIGGAAHLRLMRPMITEKGCLKCHESQGYHEGDVRGGVGVSVPLAPYLELEMVRKRSVWITHAVVWAIGLGGIGGFGVRGRQRLLERHRFAEQIWVQANFDAQTGLPNRGLFMDRLELAMAEARRSAQKLALLYVDLDHFKDVNDTRGHDVGDALLSLAAARLRDCVRDTDTVARLGGDEFAIILTRIEGSDSATRVAESIQQAMAQPFLLQGHPAYVGASLGITLYPDDGPDAMTLLKNSDAAMYQAKASGRNTYRYFTAALTRRARERVQLEHELRAAIEQDAFVLHYQPVFEAPTRRLLACEVLLRWQHPERGLLAPGEFIGVAEQSGLIVPIGELVLRKVAAQLSHWLAAGIEPPEIMVNISTRQCRAAEFLPFVEHMCAGLGRYLTHKLTFEITESLFLAYEDGADALLAALKGLGIRLSVDDFGTGYSSLAYLRRFPVDSLKIDRSFVRDIAEDANDAALCEAIVSMAHHLGIVVVAEGVETEAQLQMLAGLGCDQVQGFLLGRPQPLAEIELRLVPPTVRRSPAGAS